MYFEIKDCNDIDFGPQRATIFTYRLTSGRLVWPPFKAESYSYFIDLNDNEIDWHGYSYDQYAFERHLTLDWTKIKITAEDALRIAELNGGADARLSVENRCSINIEIDANSDNGNWIVTYGSSVTLLRIEIDKTNGQYTIRVRGEEGTYEFDPQTILDSLKSGNKDVFRKVSPLNSDVPISQHVQWTQDDYYRVADAFMETVWNERLSDWNLDGLYFESNCHDASLGPQLITFFIFRQGVSDKDHFSGQIDIKTGQNILNWTKTEDDNSQYLFEKERRKLSWSQIKIPADQALQIVEEQGGRNLRSRLKLDSPGQNCYINSWLNKWAAQTRAEWDISYYRSSTDSLIAAFVDAETGVHDVHVYEKKP